MILAPLLKSVSSKSNIARVLTQNSPKIFKYAEVLPMISEEKRLVLEAQIDYVLRDMIEHENKLPLVTEGRVDYSNTSLYKFFVAPYKDVFKAARLSLMDIGNSVRLVLSSLYASITNDKRWMIEAKMGFNERRQEINREWQPILERAKEAYGGTDPIFRMALLGPAAFFTIEGLGVSLLAGKTAAEAVTGTGWDRLVNNFSSNLTAQETLNKLRFRQQEDKRRTEEFEEAVIEKLSALEKLFFGKSLTHNTGNQPGGKNESRLNPAGILIVEKNKKEEEKSGEGKEKEAITVWAEATGIANSQNKTAIDTAKEIIRFETLRAEALKRAEIMSEAASASTFEDFVKVLKKVNEAGGKIDIAKIESDQKEKIEKMLQAKQVPAASSKLKPEQTAQQVKPTVAKEATPQKLGSSQQGGTLSQDPKAQEEEKKKIAQAVWQSSKSEMVNEIAKSLTEKDKEGKPVYDSPIKLEQKDLDLMLKHKNEDVKNAAEIYKKNQETYKSMQEKLKRLFSSSPTGA